MKKVILSTLLAATLFGASDYKYEVTPVVGYLWNKGSDGYVSTAGVDNHAVFGAQMQFNDLTSLIKPELSLLYANTTAVGRNDKGGTTTAMAGGVIELPGMAQMTPYVKAGLGYEMQANGDDGLLLDAGLGAKYALTENIALKAEWLYFIKDNQDLPGRVQNSTLLAGLSYAFGETAKPAPVVVAPKPAPVVVKPAPVVEAPKAAPVVEAPKAAPVVVAPAVAVVATSAVAAVVAPLDSDKDGVLDSQDKCPKSPAGYKVDAEGCPISASLHLNFATGSNAIDAEGRVKINDFADIMKNNPHYKATIIGHTDSVGSTASNQKLSVKRAAKVKDMLVRQGIAAKRLTVKGEGERNPVANNATIEGRVENRRIQINLTH
ncbi:MAG: OmpA family protein [Campylobacterales bacterium]|nr:OmpA family protein [Campylobacterales bacterium]